MSEDANVPPPHIVGVKWCGLKHGACGYDFPISGPGGGTFRITDVIAPAFTIR